ncbi:MAG: hypothetical protein WC003_07295 [Terrimicrobiaceae bacterium]
MNRLTLELSLKPFRDLSDRGIESVVREILRQWQVLVRQAGEVSILLWTADGSEILDYKGRPDEEIEWGRYIGLANPHETYPADPDKKSVVSCTHLYTEAPAKITYADLKRIVGILHKTGTEVSGKPVTVGATFDPGPEFAKSPFKYQRHPEIAAGATIGKGSWVSCGGTLHADPEPYAEFPQGIPEGTSVGTFLGRQSRRFLSDMGFDYLWLSNGFGFALNAWSVTGEIFDGRKFHPEHVQNSRDAILGFWRDFRNECPGFRIETRGGNFSAAMDMASGGCPIREIYEGGFDMVAPPNSPWAAMDGDYGLEIVGYLSRLATLPPNGQITYRYYLNDPWFLNSPWLDGYGREPHDIYMPLALARLDAAGEVTPVSNVAFLSIDNSLGELLEQCPVEVTPHLQEALRHRPDEPGLVTWIYPFSEYHEKTFGPHPDLEEVFFGDWFMRGAVNHGFPLGSVISSDNFLAAWKSNPKTFKHSILLAPVPAADSELERALLSVLNEGFQVLLYGSLAQAGTKLREALNLRCVEPLEGRFEMRSTLAADRLDAGTLPSQFLHQAHLSGGGIDTVPLVPGRKNWRELAVGRQDNQERTCAVVSQFSGGGKLGWLRGTFCADVTDAKLPVPHPEVEWLHTERWLRLMLAEFGYSFQIEKPSAEIRDPLFLAATSRNGFYLSGYQPSTLAKWRLRFPDGAPLLVGCDARLEDGHAIYQMPRAWHRECRCFVRQASPGVVSCAGQGSGEVGIRRRLMIKGLLDAAVRFYPEPDTDLSRLRFAPNPAWPFTAPSIPFESIEDGRSFEVSHITGSLLISW